MKTSILIIVSIYKGNTLIAKSNRLRGVNRAKLFESRNMPPMTMATRVKEGWRVFYSY